MKHANTADMRAAAVRTMNFETEARKLQTDFRSLKRTKIEALLAKVVASIKTYGMAVKSTVYDSDPRRGFLSAQISVEVLGDPVTSSEFQDILDRVLGYGWQIKTPGPDWVIEFEM